MASILFIGEEYLKTTTPISENLDTKFIGVQIGFAQDSHIQNILGEKMYQSLQVAYSAQTLDQYQAAIMLLIKPALAYRTAEAILPFIHIQIKNKGTLNLDAESGKQSSLSDMKYLMNILQDRAEFYEQRIQDYLVLNGVNFADYINPVMVGIRPDIKATFTSDLYFKDYQKNWFNNSLCTYCNCVDCICGIY